MQKTTKIKSGVSGFSSETTGGFHIPVERIERVNKVKHDNPYYIEIGKKSFPKQQRIIQSQGDIRKELIGRIKSVRTSYGKAKQKQNLFEPTPKVFLYKDKELEAIALESAKVVVQDKDEMGKIDIIKRKLMNLILGITESDLIEVARKV